MRGVVVVFFALVIGLVARRHQGERRDPWIGYPEPCWLLTLEVGAYHRRVGEARSFDCDLLVFNDNGGHWRSVAVQKVCFSGPRPPEHVVTHVCHNEAGLLTWGYGPDGRDAALVPDNGRFEPAPLADRLSAAAHAQPFAAWAAWMLLLSGLFVVAVPRFYPTSGWLWLCALALLGWTPFVYTGAM